MKSFPLIAHARGEDVLAWSDGQAITASRFLRDVRRLAAALPAGGHVLNAATDRYRFAVGLAAALLAGKVSLLPPTLTPEMVRQVRRFAPDVFCLADPVQGIDLPRLAWSDAMQGPARESAGQVAAYEVPQLAGDQLAAIVFTSGSTGTPLAHRKSWGSLVHSAQAEAARFGLLDGRRHNIVATVAPQHMYGFESSVLLALQSGGSFTASHPFYPADIAAAVAASPRPCLLVSTPVHLKALLASGLELPIPGIVISATAPMPQQLAAAVEARMRAPLLEIYGSTETGQIASRRTTEGAPWSLWPGVELSVKDGGTWACGGHVEQATPLADQLELLAAGTFLLHGRTADLVNIAGKRSSLGYLDHQLNAVPGVMDGAFFMPDDEDRQGDGVTRLMAFVVAPGMHQAALLAALRERIDPLFLPRPLVLLEALPRNGTGKLPREALQLLAREHRRGSARHAQ
jgi:acyl-coenzyme A synthetase/AMP-(fatty) acid ligase